MRRYLAKRVAGSAVTLLLASIVVFGGVQLLPGDPALAIAGQEGARNPELLDAIRIRYGLDQPLLVQYSKWLQLVVQGDFGQSIRSGVPVRALVFSRIPITLQLAGWSIVIAVSIGVPAGVLAARYRGRPLDYTANGLALSGLSIPNFWLGLVLIATLAVNTDWLPSSGYVPFLVNPSENLRHLALPAIVLGTGLAAIIMRQTRSSMIEALNQDYIRTAWSKGLSGPRVVIRHGLRNSLLTVMTIVGLQLGLLISGSAVTETIFRIPGFGRLIIEAVSARDYPVIQAVAMLSAAAYILINLVVDVLYSWLNPQIDLEAGS